MTDLTRAELEKRLSAMIHRLNLLRAEDRADGGRDSANTLSYEDVTRGFSHVFNALNTGRMTPDQVRESVERLSHDAGNASLLVRPSWAYVRGASAAAILAQKMERTGA